jgi:nucleoid-associated protein YgaU
LTAILGAIGGAIAGHKIQDGVSDWKDEKEKKKREEEEKKKREEEEKKRREEEEREKKKREEEEKRRREEEEKRRREEAKHHQQGGVRPEPSHCNSNFRGNFSGSCNNIRLEAHGDFVLRASCRRADGSYQESCISLNKYLENSNGCFRWTDGSSGGHCHAPQTVTVQPGDTLRDIAARFGTTYQEIAQLNGIPNPDLIHPGQVFRIPQKGGHGGGGNFAASARNVRLVDNGRRLEAELLRDGCWVTASIALDERIGNDNGCLRFV